jgi:hypothetical protein
MIEIAIAIGVIGFALVAIIGILPAGLSVQKDTEQDTTISLDAPFFMEAIRNGATNADYDPVKGYLSALDFLTNHVETISIATVRGNTTNINTYSNGNVGTLWNGRTIIGLLSTPEFYVTNVGSILYPGNFVFPFVTNIVTARVRALSGPAIEQNGANPITSFQYLMSVELAPFTPFELSTNYWSPGTSYSTPNEYLVHSNRWRAAEFMQFNLFELRLRFSWPILPNGNPGPNHQSYRTLVSGHLASITNGTLANPVSLVQSQRYYIAP